MAAEVARVLVVTGGGDLGGDAARMQYASESSLRNGEECCNAFPEDDVAESEGYAARPCPHFDQPRRKRSVAISLAFANTLAVLISLHPPAGHRIGCFW